MSVKTCRKCGECCRAEMGPFIFPSDVKRISDFLKISPSDFLSEWCISHEVSVKEKKVPIFYVKVREGSCAFLDSNNLCRIYDDRPYQCVNAPYDFLADFYFWSHMKCVEEGDFAGLDSSRKDREIFAELLDQGYKNI